LKSPTNPRYNVKFVYSRHLEYRNKMNENGLTYPISLQFEMSKRVTIVIDDDLDKKIRFRQAKIIQQKQASCSYSRVVNDALRKFLK